MMFSVLMSLYHKEKADFLYECLDSIKNQTIKPSEIVIVEDGPLSSELYDCLDSWQSVLPIRRVKLVENLGLGRALNEGLKHCKYDLIARMDTDDICSPLRFERQLGVFLDNAIDICGSWVSEFEDNCEIITSYRYLPESHNEIVSAAQFRNPLNHPSVMYRKAAVIEVGGYDDVFYFEDYHLWLKLIDRGYKFYNIQESLVLMRAGIGQLSRRGGLTYASFEYKFFRRSSKEGIMRKRDAIRNTLVRFPIRLLPMKALSKVYRIIRKRRK